MASSPFSLTELGNTYVHSSDRYVVSLIVGYADDEAASPEHAAAGALALTQDAGASDTNWYVYDRKTGMLHLLEQIEFESLIETLE